jgi:putative oxidoreductase
MNRSSIILFWGARILAALIMLQTLFFKFTAAEESVYIFSTIGIEPWGRILTGVLELVASVLLLANRTAFQGALLGAGLMGGAIMTHLTVLGIEVKADGGYLFALAVIVLVCCVFVIFSRKDKIAAVLSGKFSELLNFN